MALTRGRVRKSDDAGVREARALGLARTEARAAIVPRARVEAIRDAEAIRARAEAEARAIVDEARRKTASARETAMREGREEAAASLVAAFLRLRDSEQKSLASREDDVVAIARALAERLLGRALELTPSLIVDLARQSLRAAGRARRIRLFVHPDDADALRAGLGDLDVTAPHLEVHLDPALSRGSLRADTDLGALDADLPLQLDRLVAALR